MLKLFWVCLALCVLVFPGLPLSLYAQAIEYPPLQSGAGESSLPLVIDSPQESDSLPSNFPELDILTNTNPSAGEIYFSNFIFGSGPAAGAYLIILDRQGNPLFHRATPPLFAWGFTPEVGHRYSYWTRNVHYVLDSNFDQIDSFRAANGYLAEGHDFHLLPNGNTILIASSYDQMDLRSIDSSGNANAEVISNIIQIFDKNKQLIFEWRGRDHFQLTDATNEDISLTPYDYEHMNSVEVDTDGKLIVSSRNMDEITKIDPETGSIIWRWGGKHNQFSFIGDTVRFSHQHSVRRLANGHIIMMDNGNYPPPGIIRHSRVVEYALDEVNMTATKVWEFRHSPDVYSYAMGNAERLPNGNTFIGWGACDSVAMTEVTPEGTVVFELGMKSKNYSYRALKYTKGQLDGVKTSVTSDLSTQLHLGECFPNPVSKRTTIPFTVSGSYDVSLDLYDLLGRKVRTLFSGEISSGEFVATLDAQVLTNGTYLCKLTAGNSIMTKVLIVNH